MAYLLRDAQPAMNMAMALMDDMPSMKSSPTLSLPRKEFSPNGMTTTTVTVPTSSTMGATLNTARSAPSGTVSSLSASFSTSAIGWSSPNGPQRLGPSRDWKRARARRSNQVFSAVAITMAFMTMNALATPASA